ncbi:MAG: polymer-forming cytoskeletal protein [Saprospiraceae bacterium]|nr:polymer-forming cytoskeletal protein [Saprospiraceae bacterium]
MFGNSKSTDDAKKSSVSTPASGSLNALVKGTSVEGSIKCESDLRVDGTIKGKLNCAAKVIIGPTGAVEGEIKCQNAVIEGKFKGVLQVSELLNIRETADVDGEISTGKLLVQSGAKFNVVCKMETGTGNGSMKSGDLKTASSADAAQKALAGAKS